MATANKYDRQLRLWGANGQKALAESHVLLVNADAAGTETLKNLVLPGLGNFTILDDSEITHSDAGNNFFTPEYMFHYRAEAAKELLCEMNPDDVNGHFKISTLDRELQSDPNYLTPFSLVVLSNPNPAIAKTAGCICWQQNIPMCREEIGIIESRPDGELPDLRLNAPFQELLDYCLPLDLSVPDTAQHSHMPFVAILLQAIMHWREEHNGGSPVSFADKKAFVDLIKSWSRDIAEEQNYAEAVKYAPKCYAKPCLPSNVQELLEGCAMRDPVTATTSDFRIMLHALNIFITQSERHCEWPLKGSIPDMTSTSETFVDLQQIYHKKAEDDRRKFTSIVHSVLESAGRPSVDISASTIELFCKNLTNLTAVRTKSLADSISSPDTEAIAEALEEPYDDPVQTPLLFYLSALAADEFFAKHGRYPGNYDIAQPGTKEAEDAMLESDTQLVWELLVAIGNRHGVPVQTAPPTEAEVSARAALTVAHAQEITRYGGVELHNISSLIGGIAAQEAVKILCRQFIPLNNVYVYNGVAGCGKTYRI